MVLHSDIRLASTPTHRAHGVERSVVAAEPISLGDTLLRTDAYAAVVRSERVHDACARHFVSLSDLEALEADPRRRVRRVERREHCTFGERDDEETPPWRTPLWEEMERKLRLCKRGLPSNEVRLAMMCVIRKELEERGVMEREEYALLDAKGWDAVEALQKSASASVSSENTDEEYLNRLQGVISVSQLALAILSEAFQEGMSPDEIEDRMRRREREHGVDTSKMMNLISSFEINCFTIVDGHGTRLGMGLYPEASMFNHSLTPNAQAVFADETLEVKALRDIAPGEEVTISYCDPYVSKELNRKRMLRGYGFDAYAGFPNTKVADENREAATRAASKTTLPGGLGTHVDLGERVGLFTDRKFIADVSLVNDAPLYWISRPKKPEESFNITSGVALVKDESSEGDRSNDVALTWGPFPEGCDRELTALNVARIASTLDKIEDELKRRDCSFDSSEKVSSESARILRLLDGDDKIAALTRTHELRLRFHMTFFSLCLQHDWAITPGSPDRLTNELGIIHGKRALSLVESTSGFNPHDAVYLGLKRDLLDLELNMLTTHADPPSSVVDIKDFVHRVEDWLIKAPKAFASGSDMATEIAAWSSAPKGYVVDTLARRVGMR